jgi:hypothetical protein
LRLIILGLSLLSLYGFILFRCFRLFNERPYDFWAISYQEYEYPVSEIEAELRRDVMKRIKEEIDNE